MTRLHTRIILPVALVSACLLVLSVLTAVSLIGRQKSVAKVQRENLDSRRMSIELDECLTDLLLLLRDRVEDTTKLHERARLHLVEIRNSADERREMELADGLETGFAAYLHQRRTMPPAGSPGHVEGLRDAATLLETEVLKPRRYSPVSLCPH